MGLINFVDEISYTDTRILCLTLLSDLNSRALSSVAYRLQEYVAFNHVEKVLVDVSKHSKRIEIEDIVNNLEYLKNYARQIAKLAVIYNESILSERCKNNLYLIDRYTKKSRIKFAVFKERDNAEHWLNNNQY